MPHIIVKLFPGRSEKQKQKLTDKIVKNVVEVVECKERSVSVAFEEVEQTDWAQKVFQPDIIDGTGVLYKEPGYDPFLPKPDQKDKAASLMENIREVARIAEKNDFSGNFNAMSWLDIELEDNPGSFDSFFDIPWNKLSEEQKSQRAIAIRRVL